MPCWESLCWVPLIETIRINGRTPARLKSSKSQNSAFVQPTGFGTLLLKSITRASAVLIFQFYFPYTNPTVSLCVESLMYLLNVLVPSLGSFSQVVACQVGPAPQKPKLYVQSLICRTCLFLKRRVRTKLMNR